MVRSLTRRGIPKPFALLVSVLLALYFVPLGALPASAAHVPAFEIDGNLVDDEGGGIDWETLRKANDPALVVVNDNAEDSADDPGDTTVFKTSSKENDEVAGELTPESWEAGSPNTAPGKTDIGNYYKYVRTGEDGHIELFFAWDRLSPSGTDYYYLELNKEPNVDQDGLSVPDRSVGDVRFTLHELGNGDLVLLAIDEWDGEQWVSQDIVDGGFVGQVNDEDIDPAGFDSPAIAQNGRSEGKIPADQFFETEFDLTTLIGLQPDCPPTFGTLNFRSSTGETADDTGENLKDYIAPMRLDAPSTCGVLRIEKYLESTSGAPLGGAVFKITPNPLPDGVEGADLESLIIKDDSDANTDVESGTNYDDPTAAAGVIQLSEVVAGTYEVEEITPPDGYVGETGKKTVVVTQGTTATVGGTTKFVNTLGSVKFFKTYAGGGNATGATFLLERDGSDEDTLYDDGSVTVTDNGTNDANNAMGTIKVNNLKTGDWRITEVSAPTGWVPDGDTVTFTISAGTPNPELGSPTFDNPRRTYPLSVLKVGVAPGDVLDGSNIPGAVFKLWRDDNGVAGLQTTDPDGVGAQVADSSTGSCTTDANGTCTVTAQAWGFDYYWEEVSVPVPWNLPGVTVQGPVTLSIDGSTNPGSATKFSDTRSKIVTKATDALLPDDAVITDTATLSGLNSRAGGKVTFDLYGPFLTEPTADSCTEEALVLDTPIAATRLVDGNGDYASVDVVITQAGYYAWIARYSGDENGNRAVSGVCDDAGETSFVDEVLVLAEKVGKPEAAVLPRTGSTVPVGHLAGGAVALLGLGSLLMVAGRRRSEL